MHKFKNNRIVRYVLAAIAVLLLCPPVSDAQSYLETFGQNRIQYRKFDWRYFDTEHFRVYHYDAAGRQLARYIAEQAENDIKVVEQKLGGQFPHKFKIILYNNYDEYRQTNVGKQYDSQLQDVPAGTVDLAGDRLIVYFTGVHADLRKQLRSGMSKIVMQRMLFGENFKEMVKNAVLLNLPKWTTDGFIAYMVDGWDAKTDNAWKNLLAAYPGKGFHELSEQDPETAGKAFWKYVSEKYGDSGMKNLLYTMQTKSSLNLGIKMTLGQKVKVVYDSCISFYKNVYAADVAARETPDTTKQLLSVKIPDDNGKITAVRVSPRGNDVAYVVWKEGEYKVYIQKTKDEQTRSLILDGGRKDYNEQMPDPDYPLLAWSNNGYKLAVIYKKGTQTKLRIYQSLKAKIENYTIPSSRFDRVTGVSFMENDDKLVLSAIKKSQSDLYEFTIRGSRMQNITKDAWDDLEPWFVSGGSRRGILFLSNRPVANTDAPIRVNELPAGPLNVYFYNTTTNSPVLLKCSNITSGNVSQPIQYGSDNYAFLYDSSGVQNRYVVAFGRDQNNMDSAYAIPVTNYAYSIVSHQYNPASNQVADAVQQGNELKIYFSALQIPDSNATPKPLTRTTLSTSKAGGSEENGFLNVSELREPDIIQGEGVLKDGNAFQSEFENETPAAPPSSFTQEPQQQQDVQGETPSAGTALENMPETITGTADLEDSTYLKMKSQPYRLGFKTDFFTVRLDNSVLFNRYQSVSQTGGQFTNPSLGGMLSVSLNDVMENHRFTGGIRLPVNFSGLAYFLQYENFTRRVDWGILFLRTENNYNYNVEFVDPNQNPILVKEYTGKLTTNLLQGSASYPLDRIRSIRMQAGIRQDVLNFKAVDTISLAFLPPDKQYWGLSRVEYVFDNSIGKELNIRQGFRYKFFAEYLYKINNGNGGFYAFGTDFRYYHKIYKNAIAAARIAAAHSAGKYKIAYLLGGVDNWIGQKYSVNTPNISDGYAFQALATNMRGYELQSRIGNTYAVLNGELRLPVITTFVKRPVQSAVFRHLQLIGFMDVGSAWTGLLPNTSDNAGSTRTYGNLNQPPNMLVTIKVPNSTGLAMGYGAGLRTMLFGYFMRLDAAWNIEGRRKPIWYFSIGTDF